MFAELAGKRRSVRKFTSQQVEQEKIDAIIEAGLRSPSGRAARPWGSLKISSLDRRLPNCGGHHAVCCSFHGARHPLVPDEGE